MKSLVFGVIGLAIMVVLSVEGGLDAYLQKHAIFLVCGGSVFLLFFCTPDHALKVTWRSVLNLMKPDEDFRSYQPDLESLARDRTLPGPSKNKLINYAAELWAKGVDPDLFIVLVSQKRMELENDSIEALQTLKNLAKYPPGLGITGTVMGMIALFSNIDSNKDSVGSSIALAMTATFFGLFLTNVFIGPIADRVQIRFVNRKRMFNYIYKILLLINQDEPIALVTSEIQEERKVG